jgi:phage FluMu protein Com
MSYSITVNRKCSRCPRVEQTEITAEDAVRMASPEAKKQKAPPALAVSMGGKVVAEFDFLCGVCTTIVERYITHAAKQPKHQSALRGSEIDIEE